MVSEWRPCPGCRLSDSSGKGTQCTNIVENFGYTHVNASDLLRAERNSGSENGTMISNMIKEGKIVQSESVKILLSHFNVSQTGIEPEFVLFFDCPEQEMEKRLLGRNQGREDDNIETIRKRFNVYMESGLPVIEYYRSKGKVRKIDVAKPVREVFEAVKVVFAPANEKANY
ncbi:UMP-CMP kinase 3-like [Solanum dulcamara]|uniref:UMP-CMP kinase 3-like n=1 Tax=Solanum dulcamara TaxID=45834 RepID=UPI002485BB30|nr:UMP-CMP kinase 3-like [Solanum dulcamara]